MNTSESQNDILDIVDALVSAENPPRNTGALDYERCARLHNYLVAYAWMVRHGRDTPDLDALTSGGLSFWGEETDVRARLDPSVDSFLDLVYNPEADFFYWTNGLSISLVDESFFNEVPDGFWEERYENAVNNRVVAWVPVGDKERFVVIYDTVSNLGSHCLGVVYDQQRHLAAFPMTLENMYSVEPICEHEEMWFPLETILTHWIYLLRLGKIVADPEAREDNSSRSQIGLWGWLPYCTAQIENTIAAMDRYSAAIESRMPSDSLLSTSVSGPLFTDADLDAASVPPDCFIRSVLIRVKTPRFKYIAPGLEVPHDKVAFAERQMFIRGHRDQCFGEPVAAVLVFAAADPSRTVDFNDELRWLFLGGVRDVTTLSEGDLIPTGLYSEAVDRGAYDAEEAGFRLVLPFAFRPDHRDSGARRSDGSLVTSGSFTELFQHGIFHPFGGEGRSQRLERLFDRWAELVETGVWTVGRDGVEGSIDQFRDADKGDGAWEDYWIPPDW